MKRTDVKSRCPINFSLETFGDAWSLLIVRDIMVFGKQTYGEFLDSSERIGPSVLADRLAHLEKRGVISKRPDKQDKRKMIYSLTEVGVTTAPLVYELAVWGAHTSFDAEVHPKLHSIFQHSREDVLAATYKALESGSSLFTGPNSVLVQFGL